MESIDKFCLNSIVEYCCTAERLLSWSGTAFANQCASSNITVDLSNLETNSQCGIFNATNSNLSIPDSTFNDGTLITVVQSNLTFRVTSDQHGHTIQCTKAGNGVMTIVISK